MEFNYLIGRLVMFPGHAPAHSICFMLDRIYQECKLLEPAVVVVLTHLHMAVFCKQQETGAYVRIM